MSRVAKVRCLEVLYRAGYKPLASAKVLKIPLPIRLLCSANASETHNAELQLHDAANAPLKTVKIASDYLHVLEEPILPLVSDVCSSVEHNGEDAWSIDRSRIDIDYSDETHHSLFFGEPASGSADTPNPAYTLKISVPMVPAWPVPRFLHAQYPAAQT